jgi:uncharacterized protein (DUF3820 family)
MTTDEAEAVFGFGKHRGRRVRDVPTSYLCWAAVNCTRIDTGLLTAIFGELRRRDVDMDELGRQREESLRREREFRERASRKNEAGPRPADIRPIIDKWYRELVLAHHPDRGGDVAIMQVLNNARDRLLALLGQG